MAAKRSMWAPAPGLRLVVVRVEEGDTVESIHAQRCPDANIEWMRSVRGSRGGEVLEPGDFVLCTEEF